MLRRLTAVLLWPGIALGASSCTSEQELDAPQEEAAPGYFHRVTDNPGVIVFVHGVFGDKVGTWTAPNGVYWPELIKKSPAFSGYDIYLYEYRTPWCSENAFAIDEVGVDMARFFAIDSVLSNHKVIVFVMHSMGGLVTRAFFLQSPDAVVRKVGLLALYATPMQGSQVARVYQTLGACRNRQVLDMVPHQFNGFLNVQNRTWIGRRFGLLPALCAYEHRPLGPALIVEEQSATALCGQAIAPIDADHSGIVKPSSMRSGPFVTLAHAFLEHKLQPPTLAAVAPDTHTRVPVGRPAARRDSLRAAEHNANGDAYWVRARKSSDWSDYRSLLTSALAEYKTAEAFDPTKAIYHVNVGTVLNRLGRYDEAAVKLRQGIDRQPTTAWFHNELCMSLLQGKRLEEADEPCREAVRLDPRNAAFQEQLQGFLQRQEAAKLVSAERLTDVGRLQRD